MSVHQFAEHWPKKLSDEARDLIVEQAQRSADQGDKPMYIYHEHNPSRNINRVLVDATEGRHETSPHFTLIAAVHPGEAS